MKRHTSLQEFHMDSKASVQWSLFGDLFEETEGFVFVIQDQKIVDMWSVEYVEIIPIVISATGLISVSLAYNLKQLRISDGSLVARMQRAVLLNSAMIVCRFLRPLFNSIIIMQENI
ncbi:unnamed protein product [Euphydryas editha]|uniref:Uncharacterized protein n=1 Tax=Euphydryas editha TaxID=104508 RepID=A0AAU9UAI9_EUPED|nr:unnamed protein product [Euphydryas editha]